MWRLSSPASRRPLLPTPSLHLPRIISRLNFSGAFIDKPRSPCPAFASTRPKSPQSRGERFRLISRKKSLPGSHVAPSPTSPGAPRLPRPLIESLCRWVDCGTKWEGGGRGGPGEFLFTFLHSFPECLIQTMSNEHQSPLYMIFYYHTLLVQLQKEAKIKYCFDKHKSDFSRLQLIYPI